MMTKEGAAKSVYNALRDDLFCRYCGKQCKNLNSLNNHQCRCKENPDRISINRTTGIEKFWQDVKEGKRQVWNKGLSKETSSSIRKYSEANSRTKTDLEIELDDDGRLYEKWKMKEYNDKYHENYGFDLTFDQYCMLVKQAGIKSSNLGMQGNGCYVLARYGDSGPYTWGNCRFITQKENVREMKVSEKVRMNGRKQLAIFNQKRKEMTAEESAELGHKIRTGQMNSPKLKEVHERARQREENRLRNLHPSFSGSQNSQYGTFWITNGIENKKWREEKGAIPEGFRRGRVHGDTKQ